MTKSGPISRLTETNSKLLAPAREQLFARPLVQINDFCCRKDMAKLDQRAGTLSEAEPCASCGRPVGEVPVDVRTPNRLPPYFLFPTGNAFHGSCLAREVLELAPSSQRERLLDLMSQSKKVSNVYTEFACKATSLVWLSLLTTQPLQRSALQAAANNTIIQD